MNAKSIATSAPSDDSRRKGQHAFTLTELLAVIAVIAFFAVILVPALERARQTVLTAECLKNMRHLQECYLDYANDNNGSLPWNGVGNGVGGGNYSWMAGSDAQTTVLLDEIKNGVLYQYDQNVKIYRCPANTRKIPTSAIQVLAARREYGISNIFVGTLLPQTRTCSMNFPLGGYTRTPPAAGALLATGVYAVNNYTQMVAPNPDPANMFVFADENEYSVDDGDFAIVPAGSGENYWWNMPGARHKKGTTWSFADGHAEYWRWHGTVVPNAENNLDFAYFAQADSSDDLARVQACTCPLGN